MMDALLDTLQSRVDIIIDGPFAQNELICSLLGQLRPDQRILTSQLRDGTVMGTLVLGAIKGGQPVPRLPIAMTGREAAAIPDLKAYSRQWRQAIKERDAA